jgi:hypothetical protein
MDSSMRELKQQGKLSLDWNIKKSNTGKRQTPRFTMYPYMQSPEDTEFKGTAVLRDTDGTEWEAKIDNEQSSIESLQDFKKVCALYRN